MKHLFLAILLALSLGRVQAQCAEKVRTYGTDLEDILIHRIIRTSTNTFLMVGQKDLDALVMEVDACGDIVWQKTHSFGTEQGYRDVIDLGGKYVAIGYCDECKTGDSSRKFLVQEITGTGDKSGFAKTLGPSNLNAEGYRIRAVSGDRFAVVGTRTIVQGNAQGNSMVMYLLNTDYSINDFQFFGQKKIGEIAYDVVEVPGKGFVVAGTSYESDPPESSMIRLIGTNDALDQLWSNEFFEASTTLDQSARAIARLPNGDLVFTGSKVEGNQQQLFIGKVNPNNGVLTGAATFGGSGDDIGRDIVAISNDNVLVCGLKVSAGTSEGPWALVVDKWLGLKDEWQPAATGLFNSAVVFDENSTRNFAFAGTAINFAFKGIFARTVSLSTPLEVPGQPGVSLNIYPNPTAGRLHLDGWDLPADARASLYDTDGRLSWSSPARSVLDLPNLPAGTYLFRLEWSGGQMQQPLSIQR